MCNNNFNHAAILLFSSLPARKRSDAASLQLENVRPPYDRDPGHLRLRDLPEERVRAVLHQLCQREAAADIH